MTYELQPCPTLPILLERANSQVQQSAKKNFHNELDCQGFAIQTEEWDQSNRMISKERSKVLRYKNLLLATVGKDIIVTLGKTGAG